MLVCENWFGLFEKVEPNMNNEEMLELIRSDRPNQIIHKIISFKQNEYGFYNVIVDMESMFFDNISKRSLSMNIVN